MQGHDPDFRRMKRRRLLSSAVGKNTRDQAPSWAAKCKTTAHTERLKAVIKELRQIKVRCLKQTVIALNQEHLNDRCRATS